MVVKERAEAGSASWDQVPCFGKTDSGDSTKKSVENKEEGGHREDTKNFLIKVFSGIPYD